MRAFLAIRRRLGVSQTELAAALHCAQSNISYYERGQTVPPAVAKLLLAFAAERGLKLSYDHVYGDAVLPRVVVPAGG